MDKYTRKLRELQYLLYAEGKRSLLICLQALDGAGKDGTINHVLGLDEPARHAGPRVQSPDRRRTKHDFLGASGRSSQAGEVVIFNRSHYEDVLVVRVHNLVPPEVWQALRPNQPVREGSGRQGTHILKFFLHISPEEQLERFKLRLDDPARHWKISEGDYAERKFWDDYTRAYEDALSETSTKHAPWFFVPSNNKWFRNLAVAKIVADRQSLGMRFPRADGGHRRGEAKVPSGGIGRGRLARWEEGRDKKREEEAPGGGRDGGRRAAGRGRRREKPRNKRWKRISRAPRPQPLFIGEENETGVAQLVG